MAGAVWIQQELIATTIQRYHEHIDQKRGDATLVPQLTMTRCDILCRIHIFYEETNQILAGYLAQQLC
jgi:hypothetical protein